MLLLRRCATCHHIDERLHSTRFDNRQAEIAVLRQFEKRIGSTRLLLGVAARCPIDERRNSTCVPNRQVELVISCEVA